MKVFIFLALAAAAAAAPRVPTLNKSGRIVGGENANGSEFPYQVQMLAVTSIGYTYLCQGVIYDEYRVITSAKCALEIQGWSFLGGMIAGSGSNHSESRSGIVFQRHLNFTPDSYDFDIGVITLTSPLKYNENVQPIPLANETYVPSGDLVTIGFGSVNASSSGALPSQLQKATLTVVDTEECRQNFESVTDVPALTQNMICASAPGKAICSGDIGGALVAKDENGKDFLVGVASWGVFPCEGYPSVFTNIPALRSWLEKTLYPLEP